MVLVAVDEKIVAVTTGCVLLCQDHLEQQENSSGSFSLYRRSRYRVMVENIPEGTSWQVRVLSRVYSLSLFCFRLVRMRSGSLSLPSPLALCSLLGFVWCCLCLSLNRLPLSLSLSSGTLGWYSL